MIDFGQAVLDYALNTALLFPAEPRGGGVPPPPGRPSENPDEREERK